MGFRTNSLACVKLLAESGQVSEWDQKQLYLYGMKDLKGESPIDIAIKHHSIRITEYLITAHPSPEAWLKDDMMEKIYSTLPEAMVPLMNQSLRYNPAKFHERNESIDVEFGTVTGYSDPVMDEPKPETKFLHHIMYAPKEIQRTVFLHPLVQIFLDLKWKNIRWLTWLAILFQSTTWIILYTVMVFEIYIPNCSEGESNNATSPAEPDDGTSKKKKTLRILLSLGFVHRDDSNLEDCDFNHGSAQCCAVILYFLSIVIIVKEIFQMRHFSNYFVDVTNYAQLLVILIAFTNSAPAWQSTSDVDKWQTYLAAFGCFVAWVLSLREVGKFPRCGIYAAILKKVFWHCLKMLIFYFPLLVAFTLCLRILIPVQKGQYTYLFFAIVKVVIMMTGELDFEDAFYGDDGPSLALNAIFGQFVFLLLVFITTIVLLNLLTGLAVNDVQSLIEEAEINRLSNELEQIYLLESLIQMCREKCFGLERWSDLFYSLNVTTTKYPDYCCFTSLKQNVETKSYPQDLKERIRKNMIPIEEN
ncbi:Transient receptor potential channel pyrexia [Orchesella cincta]|uniref:Transient receptor potential channel pyrexia n=1 Tax=Orchesella cincta TaxID=48709 RepID=A0A1D2NBC7_ORCCI|nr:Transient receptor potential channel pyrexia [Orchesella cincta]